MRLPQPLHPSGQHGLAQGSGYTQRGSTVNAATARREQECGGATSALLHVPSLGAASCQLSARPARKPPAGCPVSTEEEPREFPSRCRAPAAAARGAAPHSAQERFLSELCSRLFATQSNAKQRHTDPEDSFTPQPVTGRSSRACLRSSNPSAPSELSLRIPIRGSSSSRTELGCMMESKDGSQVDVVSYGKTPFFSSQGLGGQSAQRRKRTSFCYMKN